MKKLNSFLCLLLCMSLILPVGITSVFADDINAEDAYYKTDLEFISNLGISELADTSDYYRTVTRGEFVSMAVKMLNLKSFAENDGTFTDVDADNPYSPYIYTAYKFGMLKGTTGSTFSPDSPITYAAAIKILIGILGYEEYAYLKGGYPAGYILEAKSIGMLDGVIAYETESPLCFGTVVTLISNSLLCDIRKVSAVSGDYVQTTVDAGNNCLTQYYKLKHISGIVATAGYHSIIDGYNEEKNFVQINNTVLDNNISDVEAYLGMNVDAWYDAKTNSLAAIKSTHTDKIVTIDAKDVDDFSSFLLTAHTDDTSSKTKSYKLKRGYTFVLNGRVIVAQASDFKYENGSLTLIDNDNDNIFDIVISKKITHVAVRAINYSTKEVYDSKKGDINLFLSNEDGYHYTLTKDGVEADISEVKNGVVLEAVISGDNYLADVTICSESVRGEITQIGEDVLYVDGIPYEITEYFNTYFTPELGQKGTFLLDTNGKLVYISGLYIDSVHYAYFLDYGVTNGTLENTSVVLKLFTDAGNIEYFDLAEKVKFNGNLYYRSHEAIKNQFKPDRVGKDAVPVYQLIRFATNKDGFIDLIDTAEDLSVSSDAVKDTAYLMNKYSETISADNSLTRYVDATKPIDSVARPKLQSNAYWRKAGNAFIPHFTLGDTILMEVPKDLRENNAPDAPYAESAFRIIGTGNLPNYEYVYIDAFDYNESMIPKIVVLYRGEEKSGETKLVEPNALAPVHLVERVADGVTEDGEITKRIYSYAGKKFHITDVAPEVVDSLIANDRIPKPGETVRLSFSGGEINGIARDIRNITANSVTVNTSDKNIGKACTSNHTYVTGKVFSCIDGSNIVIKYDFYPMPDDEKGIKDSPYAFPEDGVCSVRADSSTTIAIYNVQTGLTEHGDISEIRDIRSVGESDASYICVALDGYDPEMIIIYR